MKGSSDSFWGLKGSASFKGKTLTITAVNPSVDATREAQIVIRGADVTSAAATVLSAEDIHAHNTFEQQDAVQPKQSAVKTDGRLLHFTFPPACVAKLQVELS